MVIYIVIANIINLLAGICSIISVQGKNKKQIVMIEFIGSILRIVSNFLVKSFSDVVAKIIKACAQIFSIKDKLNKVIFFIVSILYICICLIITYVSNDLRCLIAIIPSVIEFYSLLAPSTKKYRWYIVITKLFWTINNLLFGLFVGIVFDSIIIVGHLLKIRKNK